MSISEVSTETSTETPLEKYLKTCTHYDNNVLIYGECCKDFFECHLCHNETKDHTLNRKKINKVKCINCNSINRLGENCRNCNIQFAKKYCGLCNIWCSKIINTYHCYDCNKCRVGNRLDYIHCNTCNMCLSKKSINIHKCNFINKNDDCPICLNKLFVFCSKITILKCSHLIHTECYDSLLKAATNNRATPRCMLCRANI